jgi:hypothetical protein
LAPTLSEIHEYRDYLKKHAPIDDNETRFLEYSDDLVSLARPNYNAYDCTNDEDAPTPMPRMSAFIPSSPASEAGSNVSADDHARVALPHLAIGMAVAILLPILTFPVIPAYVGRMTVVLLVGLSVLSGLMQSGLVRFSGEGSAVVGTRDWLLCAGVYGGVMAITAGLFR